MGTAAYGGKGFKGRAVVNGASVCPPHWQEGYRRFGGARSASGVPVTPSWQGLGREATPERLPNNLNLNPLCDIPSGCCSFTGPWTVTRSSLRMLRRVATFCLLRPVLLLVSFPRSRSPVVGVLGLC